MHGHNLYHGEGVLPVGYGGWWESAKAFAYTYIPVVAQAARVFSREDLPCMIAYGNKLRKMETEAALGDRVAKKTYDEIRKREKKLLESMKGPVAISRPYKDFCKWLDSTISTWEAKKAQKEQEDFEKSLATYDPTGGGGGLFAPPATVPAGAMQTSVAPAAGGISTTTLLMAGAGALLLVALLKKKGGDKGAPDSRFAGF